MRKHARHLVGVCQGRLWCGRVDSKAAQCQTPFIGDHLHSRGQVERAKLRVGGDAQAGVAAVNILIAHAKALRAEQKSHAHLLHTGRYLASRPWLLPVPAQQGFKMRPGGECWRPKITWRHGSRAEVGDAFEGLLQTLNLAGTGQHIERTAGALNGLLPPQHIGPTRRHQHQVIKAHGFEGARCCADITSMAGVDEDKTCLHGTHGIQAKWLGLSG